jgi:hypothetical protein
MWWHIQLEKNAHNTFAQWQIAVPPGHYLFEDFGNALTIIAQKSGDEAILLCFPMQL